MTPKPKTLDQASLASILLFGFALQKINDFIQRIIRQQHQQYSYSPDTDSCLLGKRVGSLGKKTFYVGAGMAERILEVIVLI